MKNALTPELTAAIARLRAAVSARQVTQTQIARATGIDQSQISRILAGEARRASRHVLALCSFADRLDHDHGADPTRSSVLMDALRAVWDGTASDAEAIAGVILSLRKLKEAGQ
jgi:transcriptional regulator with XRE-family HTH domain